MKHDHISFKEHTMDNLSLPSNIADLIPRDNMAHVVHKMVERIPSGSRRRLDLCEWEKAGPYRNFETDYGIGIHLGHPTLPMP
ncbi:hypothetical protein [Geobacillus genomosp. 3]|uniref:hypothetical protein n=1 Tax=Geobacillus genomosp. 3 TaxID=1921421 RepID=UPI001F3C1F1F|nr:hypothetical protein [Geobacillus genomosp. 3]